MASHAKQPVSFSIVPRGVLLPGQRRPPQSAGHPRVPVLDQDRQPNRWRLPAP